VGFSVRLRSRARRIYAALREQAAKLRPPQLIALLTALGLVAVIISAWLANSTDELWQDKLWLEVAKAGVWVVAVGVLGGALGAIWKNISADREVQVAEDAKERDRRLAEDAKERDRQLERNDKIRAELASLVGLYNDVKAVRRTLRSFGFDPKYPTPRTGTAAQTSVLTAEQARAFQAQMQILNGLQLHFEAKAKQFGQTDFLDADTQQVVTRLFRIENHLNQVLQVWEHSGWAIQEGTALNVVSEGLIPLFRVRDHLRPQVSQPMREITALINKHVFGEARKDTQKALKEGLAAHDNREAGDEGGKS
jgi:hypothetical protein